MATLAGRVPFFSFFCQLVVSLIFKVLVDVLCFAKQQGNGWIFVAFLVVDICFVWGCARLHVCLGDEIKLPQKMKYQESLGKARCAYAVFLLQILILASRSNVVHF